MNTDEILAAYPRSSKLAERSAVTAERDAEANSRNRSMRLVDGARQRRTPLVGADVGAVASERRSLGASPWGELPETRRSAISRPPGDLP